MVAGPTNQGKSFWRGYGEKIRIEATKFSSHRDTGSKRENLGRQSFVCCKPDKSLDSLWYVQLPNPVEARFYRSGDGINDKGRECKREGAEVPGSMLGKEILDKEFIFIGRKGAEGKEDLGFVETDKESRFPTKLTKDNFDCRDE
ncbi:hypothetical protein ACH5RR_028848 [Cinchona calisaya]|uniref:Uncharacterized protein n=1 Tax=Cinchona calisaya TaxID=153742 RepID=A0ABD2YUG0_9GENT